MVKITEAAITKMKSEVQGTDAEKLFIRLSMGIG